MAKYQHRALSTPTRCRAAAFSSSSPAPDFPLASPRRSSLPAVAAGPEPNSFDPTIWYSIDRDGLITVNIIRAEMGQHIGTALARILADELEADWNKVRIDAVDTDPKWGVMMTGGSTSVFETFPIFSRAGAAGRIALVDAGAKLLGVPSDQCVARLGAVVAADRSISYADIIRRGDMTRTFTADELAKMPIKPASQRRLIGQKVQAIDIPDKTNGTRGTGSMPPSKAWSMRGPKFRRRVTAQACARSTIPLPRRSGAISAALPSRTRPIPFRVG